MDNLSYTALLPEKWRTEWITLVIYAFKIYVERKRTATAPLRHSFAWFKRKVFFIFVRELNISIQNIMPTLNITPNA
jgi:hypothetical protein